VTTAAGYTPQSFLRALILATAGAALLAGLCGLTVDRLFSQPSTAKYLATVLGPAAVISLAFCARPARLLTGALILCAPFSFVASFGGITVSPIGLLLPAGVVVALFSSGVVVRRSNMVLAVLAFVCALAMPILIGAQSVAFSVLLATLVGAGWLVYRTAGEPDGGLQFVLRAFALSVFVQALLAIWESHTGQPLDLYSASGQGTFASDYFYGFEGENRASGALPDPISLGNVLAIGLPILVVLAAAARSLSDRVTYLAVASVTAVALILTFSRMSWLGALAGVLLTLCLLPRGPRARMVIAVAVAAVVVVLAAGAGSPAVNDRLHSIADPTNRQNSTSAGDQTRVRLWNAALTTAQEHPAFGVGFGNLVPYLAREVSVADASHAHSTYLQILAETGIVGAVGLLVLLSATLQQLRHGLRRHRVIAAGLAGSLLAMGVSWLTDYTVRFEQVGVMFAMLFGLIAGLPRLQRT